MPKSRGIGWFMSAQFRRFSSLDRVSLTFATESTDTVSSQQATITVIHRYD